MQEPPNSVEDSRRRFRGRWWLANASGFIVAHLVYSLVGHGFTGSHGDQLTWAQYSAHTIGLMAAALIILALQRAVLSRHVPVSRSRVLIGTIAFVVAFWLGAEAIGPPADWIFGFTVLGVATWIGLPDLTGSRTVCSVLALLGFWGGIAVAAGAVFVCIMTGIFDPEAETLLNHTIFWVVLGGTTGVAGGYLSGWSLGRLVIAPTAAGQSV